MIFDEASARDAQKFLALPKRRILEKKSTPKSLKNKSPKKNVGASKNEMSEIVWNMFAQSFTPIGATCKGSTASQNLIKKNFLLVSASKIPKEKVIKINETPTPSTRKIFQKNLKQKIIARRPYMVIFS